MAVLRRVGRPSSILTAVLATLALALAAAAAPALADDAPTATVAQGQVRGFSTAEGDQFLGLPYAAPPVGALRWKAPRPPASWQGVRDATHVAPTCAQGRSVVLRMPRSTSEDCLYLNVFSPPGVDRNAKLPVMLWIHGGSFVSGAGSQYDAARLADLGDVVVITINYRLGPFGFMAIQGLSDESGAGSGDYGIEDQIAALRWARDNATAFGGDAANVTIFGQSAGGASVCSLLASPQAAGLFQRAIIQSGPCGLSGQTLKLAQGFGTVLAWKLGCFAPARQIACLRSRTADAILTAANADSPLAALPGGSGFVWAPVSGTATLPTSPGPAIKDGRLHRVPVMIGTTHDEASPFIEGAENAGIPVNAKTYPLLAGVLSVGRPLQATKLYPPTAPDHPYELGATAMATDAIFSCPAHQTEVDLAGQTPTYAYEFTDPTTPVFYDEPTPFSFGAFHAADLAYLFEGDYLYGDEPAPQPTPAQLQLSDTMIGYWSAFARSGDPNGGGRPAWPVFRPVNQQWQRLDTRGVEPVTGFTDDHHCGFWDQRPLLDLLTARR